MKDRTSPRFLTGALLVHVVCCGGLLLWPLIGTAGLSALGGYLGDPLLQGAALLIGGGIGVAVWLRYRRMAAHRASPLVGSQAGIPQVNGERSAKCHHRANED
ncbi:MAG: hypothetical protein HY423_06430 [Candidatus Lambdaproteobacteria bacterium]|nr:hypothetical protein [Candidatus Lambdaproteobacteria bacterium]